MADAVTDAGPLIHLHQIDRKHVLTELYDVSTTRIVIDEVGNETVSGAELEVAELEVGAKDFSKYLVEGRGLDLGEASAIALCRQEGKNLLFTDDLDARDAAEEVGLNPHGTLGLVARAFREEVLTREEAVDAINSLYRDSSLFITKDLVNWAIRKIDKHGER